MNGASFRVVRAVHQALQTCVHQSSGAHGARLNCNKQLAVSQAMVTEVCTGFAQGDDFGVSSGIVVGDIAVCPAAYDLAVADDN